MAGGNQFAGLIGKGERKANEEKMADLLYDIQTSKTAHHASLIRMFTKQDSKEYQAVERALENVVFDIDTRFTDDVVGNEKMIAKTIGDYYKLLAACDKYANKKGGTSDKGAARKAKVAKIQEYAQRDLNGIEQVIYAMKNMDGQQQSNLTWDGILHSARAETMVVDNLMAKTALGAGIKKGERAARLLNEDGGVFIPDTMITKGDLECNAFSTEGLQSDKTQLNPNSRNVALGRVASLLGIGGIVEQSKTVKVEDKASNNTYSGVLMGLARGKEAMKAMAGEAIEKKTSSYMKRQEFAYEMFSPNIQKELSSLQVLDYICGQGDRHTGNYMIQKEGKQYNQIHAIDNDMSFASGVDHEERIRGGGREDRKGQLKDQLRMVVDSKNNLMIPHMDRQLAENIMNLKEDELRFVLKDLLPSDMIEFCVLRFRKVREAIKKELSNSKSDVFVEEGGWGRKTHEKFMENSMLEKLVKKLGKTTGISDLRKFTPEERYELQKNDSYYSVLIADAMGFPRGTQQGAEITDWI